MKPRISHLWKEGGLLQRAGLPSGQGPGVTAFKMASWPTLPDGGSSALRPRQVVGRGNREKAVGRSLAHRHG